MLYYSRSINLPIIEESRLATPSGRKARERHEEETKTESMEKFKVTATFIMFIKKTVLWV